MQEARDYTHQSHTHFAGASGLERVCFFPGRGVGESAGTRWKGQHPFSGEVNRVIALPCAAAQNVGCFEWNQ